MLIDLQNKMGLCLLAHWMEEDGFLPEILCENYKDIIKSESSRNDYLSKLPENKLPNFKFLIKNIHLPYQQLIERYLDDFSPLKVEYKT